MKELPWTHPASIDLCVRKSDQIPNTVTKLPRPRQSSHSSRVIACLSLHYSNQCLNSLECHEDSYVQIRMDTNLSTTQEAVFSIHIKLVKKCCEFPECPISYSSDTVTSRKKVRLTSRDFSFLNISTPFVVLCLFLSKSHANHILESTVSNRCQ